MEILRRSRWLPLWLIVSSVAFPASGAGAGAAGQGTNARDDARVQAAADFRFYCADCHGPRGRGDTQKSFEFREGPLDLTTLSRRNHGVFPRERLLRIVDGRETVKAHGTREMPVWGHWLKLEAEDGLGGGAGDEDVVRRRVARLVEWIETLQE